MDEDARAPRPGLPSRCATSITGRRPSIGWNSRWAAHHVHLGAVVRVADRDAHQEAVELRLGQGEGARPSRWGSGWRSGRTGSGGGGSWPSTETCRSSIASRNADCVRGVARLISSASTHVREDGPRPELEGQRPSGCRCETPVTSLGSRSGVHWMRRIGAVDRAREGAGEDRLAHARHVLDEHVARGRGARPPPSRPPRACRGSPSRRCRSGARRPGASPEHPRPRPPAAAGGRRCGLAFGGHRPSARPRPGSRRNGTGSPRQVTVMRRPKSRRGATFGRGREGAATTASPGA